MKKDWKDMPLHKGWKHAPPRGKVEAIAFAVGAAVTLAMGVGLIGSDVALVLIAIWMPVSLVALLVAWRLERRRKKRHGPWLSCYEATKPPRQ